MKNLRGNQGCSVDQIPLLSEHGGSFTEDRLHESGKDSSIANPPAASKRPYDVRREVEEACRLMGGVWKIRVRQNGAVSMKRIPQKMEHA